MDGWCNILIVDDELLVRQGIRHHLNWEQYGFRIIGEAANGKEALGMVERFMPHIVITDIVMPIMDGEEFTRILKTYYPQIEVIVLSSYGEFDYVRSTFQSGVADYILKPKLETDELLKVLINTARKIPGVDVGAWTAPKAEEMMAGEADGQCVSSGTFLSEEQREDAVNRQLDRMLAGYGNDETTMEMFIGYFPFDSFMMFGSDLNRVAGDPNRYRSALFEQIKERFQNQHWDGLALFKMLHVPANDKQLLMLINLPSNKYGAFLQEIRLFADEKCRCMPEMVWAASGLFTKIEQLQHVYREEWLKLLAFRFYFPERTLITTEELPPIQDPPVLDLNQLMDDLRKKNIVVAFKRIREYVDEAVSHYVTPPFELKSQLGNIIFHTAIGLAESFGRNEQVKTFDELKYAYFKSIDEAQDVMEAVKSLNLFLNEAEKLGVSDFPEDSNMKKLLAYIDEHYSEPLRLSSLSEHFHFNPSYLSGYFSTHHSEGFSEYLNKTRVSKACELLRSNELSISQIGAKVGYADHSYFTKVFKKYTGMSPSRYRRQHYIDSVAEKRE